MAIPRQQKRKVMMHRWPIWGILVAIYVISYFHRLALAVVAKELMADFQTTGKILGTLAALYDYSYTAMLIPVGVLADTLGPKRTTTIGTIVMGLGSIVFGLAPSVGVAYLGRVLVGLGASVVFICAIKIAANWYRMREFATMSGLTLTAGNMGGLFAATPLALLVGAIGWRNSFHLVGAVTLLFAVLCWILVKDKPTDVGLPSITEIEIEEGTLPRTAVAAASAKVRVKEGLKIVLLNPYTWPAFLIFFGFYSTYRAYAGLWGVPYFRDVYGIEKAQAANYMMAIALGIIVGSPLAGYLSDKVLTSRRLPYSGSCLLYTLVWAILTFTGGGKPPLGWMHPLSFLFGLLMSGFIITWACGKEVNPPQYAGIATATVNMGGFLGAAIMQGVLGAVLDKKWQGVVEAGARVYPLEAYQAAFKVCLLTMIITTLVSLLVKETRCQNVYEALTRKKRNEKP